MKLTDAQMASLRILKTLLFLTASHHLSMVATAFILITSSCETGVGLEGEGQPTLDRVRQLWSDLATGILMTVLA